MRAKKVRQIQFLHASVFFIKYDPCRLSGTRSIPLACSFIISILVARTPKRETAPEQGVREFNERRVCFAFRPLLHL